jgi:starch synthase
MPMNQEQRRVKDDLSWIGALRVCLDNLPAPGVDSAPGVPKPAYIFELPNLWPRECLHAANVAGAIRWRGRRKEPGLKIVHAASELYPYVKTGGLADAVGALTGTFADRGHEVSVFLPGYRDALLNPGLAGAERMFRLKIEMGDQYLSGDVLAFSPRKNLTVYLICRDEFFDRRFPYGNGERDYEDNADRFTFFCKAVVETMRLAELGADIVHAHDWQTALLPLLLRDAERRFGVTLAMKTIFTVHNIAFQGLFPATFFPRTNLPEELYSVDGLEYYGQVSFLKGGILFADRVTTVSPRYAKEIQTPEFGCGLEGVVQTRVDDLSGLINGVDDAVWNPSTDPLIPALFSASNLAGKQICKVEVLRRCGFDPSFRGPIFGMICRLTEQKGVDLVLANAEFFVGRDCRLVVLGTGDKRMEGDLRRLADLAPQKVFMCAKLDEGMSHLIESGVDFFLMPSLFEPCGLNQMYSQVYGTVPVVSRVGGLVDTVRDADDDPAGTGLMCEPNAEALGDALDRALRLFADKPRHAAVQQRAMARDFSWRTAALAYEALYHSSL